MIPAAIVPKLWNFCHVLRDDGMSYGDYVEQLTFLLFLKMADEHTKAPYNQKSPVPAGNDWPSLIKKDGDELFDHYRHILEKLGQEKGLLGLIFGRAQNKFQDPAKLRRMIVDLLDRENWSIMSADVKGDAYEGLRQDAQQGRTSAPAGGRRAAANRCGPAIAERRRVRLPRFVCSASLGIGRPYRGTNRLPCIR
ncbi:MAG TPA: type I restriction-modification system subunit M N-terminal domain-containing protein [Geobacteraceae bacterium]|nr:type I restriction-modification system subunit M N-terminal domain-containing protein [Geobacteraceae bacterium]